MTHERLEEMGKSRRSEGGKDSGAGGGSGNRVGYRTGAGGF